MRIHSVTLNNIKSFAGRHTFDFSLSEKINTISGINGSGKTTIFKSIILAQKIFFREIHKNANRQHTILSDEELLNTFTKLYSFISLDFEFSDKSLASIIINCTRRNKNNIKVELQYTEESFEKISEYWNLVNPRNLIIYIDSNRNIVETDFSNKSIQINQHDFNDLAFDYIFHPDKIFFSTYNRFISDYLRERLIPSTPRADMAHYISKILIHDILDYLKIANFTALERKDQFILQVKKVNTSKASFYDVRNLSSGEKTLFYIYHFICYIRNIGMLIIDEPENNLHENMLTKFVLSLNEICDNDDFAALIIKIAQKNGIEIPKNQQSQITKYYKDHKLTQVFLLTHSKNLIYNNFTQGKNFIVNNGLEMMEYDSYEKKLRQIGLSKIINKVLFVEGKSENEILQKIMSAYSIKVMPLGGCGEVISTYKRYLSIATEIRDVQFCFMIDRDTRGNEDIDALRNINMTFFDEHFIVMDRHEIENYFLETKMIHKLYLRHKKMYNQIVVPTVAEIESEIKAIADVNKPLVIRKKIQSLNQKSLAKIKTAISNKSLPINEKSSYESHIDSVFTSQNLEETITNIKKNFETAEIFDREWDQKWLELCDGKIVFNNYLASLSRKLEIQQKRAIKELIEIGLNDKTLPLHSVINKVFEILS